MLQILSCKKIGASLNKPNVLRFFSPKRYYHFHNSNGRVHTTVQEDKELQSTGPGLTISWLLNLSLTCPKLITSPISLGTLCINVSKSALV